MLANVQPNTLYISRYDFLLQLWKTNKYYYGTHIAPRRKILGTTITFKDGKLYLDNCLPGKITTLMEFAYILVLGCWYCKGRCWKVDSPWSLVYLWSGPELDDLWSGSTADRLIVLCGVIGSGTLLVITISAHLWLLRGQHNSSYVASGTDRKKAYWTSDLLVSIVEKQNTGNNLLRRRSQQVPRNVCTCLPNYITLSQKPVILTPKKISFQGTFSGNIWSSWKSWTFIFYGLEGSTPICTIL